MAGAADLIAAAEAIRAARSVTIASHVDPDGDAIGSCLGLAHALDRMGIDNTLVLPSGTTAPATYAFLPGVDRFVPSATASRPDVFVALDSPELRRLGDAESLARSAQTLIVIDHHPDAEPVGVINVIDSEAAATGCIVWELLGTLGVKPDAAIATCLYAALLTDTGRFSYSNTTPDALRTAAAMIEAGADPNAVYVAVYESRSAAAQKLIGLTLERVTLANGGRVAYSWITEEDFRSTGALAEESENLIDHVRALRGVDAVLLAKVDGDTVRGSLRAKSDADVGSVARHFGGGGHRAAAGFTFTGDLETLLGIMLPMLPGAAG